MTTKCNIGKHLIILAERSAARRALWSLHGGLSVLMHGSVVRSVTPYTRNGVLAIRITLWWRTARPYRVPCTLPERRDCRFTACSTYEAPGTLPHLCPRSRRRWASFAAAACISVGCSGAGTRSRSQRREVCGSMPTQLTRDLVGV